MNITERNGTLTKDFIRLLMIMNCSKETIHLIMTALKDEKQMMEMAKYMDKNREATEQDLIRWVTDR